MSGHLSSYPSIFALGHRAIAGIFPGPVTVEEKIDGSQFSMGVLDGELVMRSKKVAIDPDNPGMFAPAVETCRRLADNLIPELTYRCEYLAKPKHNTLAYGRVPAQHLVVFDIEQSAEQEYMPHADKSEEAARLGLEAVPLLHEGEVYTIDTLLGFLERLSFLGGARVEGFVVKNYELFTAEKKVAIGKYVSEAFKEVHGKDWRSRNPNKSDVIEGLVGALHTEARWHKAVQHLAESGDLTNSPRDIGALIREVQNDIMDEEGQAIADTLLKAFWPRISKGVIAGLPEWYKRELLGEAVSE